MANVRARHIRAPPRRHEQAEYFQHLLERPAPPIIPPDDALGRVTPAEEPQLDIWRVNFPRLVRDVDEQSALADGEREARLGSDRQVEHVQAVIEARVLVLLVR